MSKTVSPVLGYNNNVRHRGRVFHIQTEDSGVKHPHVITHLFVDGGRIIKSLKTSYAEHLGAPDLPDRVRLIMREQHKRMFISLREGLFDAEADTPQATGTSGVPTSTDAWVPRSHGPAMSSLPAVGASGAPALELGAMTASRPRLAGQDAASLRGAADPLEPWRAGDGERLTPLGGEPGARAGTMLVSVPPRAPFGGGFAAGVNVYNAYESNGGPPAMTLPPVGDAESERMAIHPPLAWEGAGALDLQSGGPRGAGALGVLVPRADAQSSGAAPVPAPVASFAAAAPMTSEPPVTQLAPQPAGGAESPPVPALRRARIFAPLGENFAATFAATPHADLVRYLLLPLVEG